MYLSFIFCELFIVMMIVFNCSSVTRLYFIKKKPVVHVIVFLVAYTQLPLKTIISKTFINAIGSYFDKYKFSKTIVLNSARSKTVRMCMTLCNFYAAVNLMLSYNFLLKRVFIQN